MKRMILKTMLIISTCAVLVVSAIAIVSIISSSNAVKMTIKERAYYEAVKCANQMSMVFENAEGSLDSLVASITHGFDMTAYSTQDKYLAEYMEEIAPAIKEPLRYIEDASGLYITFNPQLEGYDGKYEIWYSINENGEVVFTDAAANGVYLEVFEDIGYPYMEYYYEAIKHSGEGVWTGPYWDPDVEEDLLTYSRAIYVDGMLLGVMGVDILTDHTTDIIKGMEVMGNGIVMLISENTGEIIVSNKEETVTSTNIWNICSEDVVNSGGTLEVSLDNNEYLVCYSELSNDWMLAVINDTKVLYKSVNNIQTLIVMLSIVLVLLTIAVMYFAVSRFARPVRKATELLTSEKNKTNDKDKNKADIEELVREQLQKQREKDLLIAHQSRQAQAGEMLSNILHQWKQPLNKLSILLGNLRDAKEYGQLTDEELERTVKRSEELIASLSTTINDFRGYLSPDSEKCQFSAAETVESALVLFEERFKINRITVNSTYKEDRNIFGHRNALYHAIINVISNAVDALEKSCSEDRRMDIGIEMSDDYIVINLFNNGGNIPADVLDRVFESYVTTKEIKEGNGLGLTISRQLIEKDLGGTLELDNCLDGVMCRIRVRGCDDGK